jgi:4a-hydroxytetrahydrobiopterin dehydratase
MAKRMERAEVEQELKALNGWRLLDDREAINKTFTFPGFTEAFRWMVQVALFAEQMDHHPEWCNVYNHVAVTLATHDAEGVTRLDLAMASKMNELAGA